jgi:hypothetical protein
MARSEGAEGPAQHLADAIAGAFARAEQPGEHLAVHARQNWLSNRVFESYDDIVDHCCYAWNTLIAQPWKIMSAPRLGLHRSINLRIGISRETSESQAPRFQGRETQPWRARFETGVRRQTRRSGEVGILGPQPASLRERVVIRSVAATHAAATFHPVLSPMPHVERAINH